MEKKNLNDVPNKAPVENVINTLNKGAASEASNKNKKIRATRARRGIVLLDKNTNFYITEAYKTIRSNLMFSLAKEDAPCKKILVSSAEQGEGKSTVSINLAITFAQTGERVLIIEGDMRRPVFAKRLGVSNKVGLSTYLAGQCTLNEAIFKSEEYGFDYIPSGQIPPNPSELVLSDRMTQAMLAFDEMYDYVIIDTPPITVVSETVGLARHSSGVVLVVRANVTTHALVERAMSALEFADAKLLGFVLNGEDLGNVLKKRGYKYRSYKRCSYGNYGGSYGYYGGYGYGGYGGYGYGYGYGYGAPSHHNPPAAEEPQNKERFEK